MSVFDHIDDYWHHWGFEPWTQGSARGVGRRVTFRKGALLGEVACYFALDRIIWEHEGLVTARHLLAESRPIEDVMTQRFLLVGEEDAHKPLMRAFLLGFRGYAEVLFYKMNGVGNRKFKDLTDLVDAAPGYFERKNRS